ncbi:MAG TPA: ATP-binding protein [Syntrophales bacterium]|nr:ATP-binding protein [Syntrophales bacterium]
MSDNIQVIRALGQRLPVPERRRLVLLTGARQTGKTTLARHRYPDLRYINLDAPENREALRGIASPFWARDVGPAVLDEAQKEPVIFEKVKFAYDDGSLSFSVLLGSSQILLLKKIRETLAGRIAIFELWPLMMSEIFNGGCAVSGVGVMGDGTLPRPPVGVSRPASPPLVSAGVSQPASSISTATVMPLTPPLVDALFSAAGCDEIFGNLPEVLLADDDAPRRRAQDDLLQWGGMPALISLTPEERRQWLRDYEYTYLERDVADLARLDDLMPFRKFQRLAALRSGRLLNYAELARDAAVSVDTARRYLEYLRLSYQTFLLPPYHANLTSTVVKTPKTYWLDIGLLRHLTGIPEAVTGEFYESMVVGEWVKWMKTMGREGELYFYRTRSGLEVDVLFESVAGVVGAEIKARRTLAARDATGLKEIAAALGKRWRGGMVIYAGNELKRIGAPQLWAVPSHRLFTRV